MAASKLTRFNREVQKGLVWTHRWLGIAACLVFALWFASGAVLLFRPFPALSASDRSALSVPVDLTAVRVAPAAALAAAGADPTGLRLVQRAGLPTYIVEGRSTTGVISAIDGRRLPMLTSAQARTIGTTAFGHAPAAVDGPIDYDQWVVDNQFDPERPLYRVSDGGPDGTRIYISARTGEIIQRTNTADRGWNWVGAVLHWAYFTPLRKNFTAWDQTVWWGSLIAMFVAVSGATLGVIRMLAVVRSPRPGLTPYRLRWIRYHHLLGLFFGPLVVTWILSGWLSMDNGRLFSDGRPSVAQSAAYAGAPLSETARQVAVGDLATLGPAVAVSLRAVGGQPVLVATRRDGRLIPAIPGAPAKQRAVLAAASRGLASAWPGLIVSRSDAVAPDDFYALAEGLPPTINRFELIGDAPLSVYIDSTTGELVRVMDRSRASYSWLYYGLHTFKFPLLISWPIVRYMLVLVAMIVGFAFSATGMVIGFKRLKKTF